ncbi:hypothetical protein MTR67_023369 [Solanum verrucosum]|uniref:Integrase catalytic domain-containing protein n=1 Tax=Solanum verrucosum TaxID=315347 RepID=A0AAF0QTB8_SOLVR|nr:hypothetical protein MTR67_023369 [Solanum verrucosum]
MYYDLREVYWCNGIKKDIMKFMAKFPNCQQVKVEHQKPGNFSQDISIPTWKWEDFNMDYIMLKSAHFIPVKVSNSVEDYVKMYLTKMVRLNRVTFSIISDYGTQFTSQFGKSLKKGLGSRVKLSMAFHCQTDG